MLPELEDQRIDSELRDKICDLSQIITQNDYQSELQDIKTLSNSFDEEALKYLDDPEHINFIPDLSIMSDNSYSDPLNRAFIMENSMLSPDS